MCLQFLRFSCSYSLSNPRARLQFLTPTHGDLIANLDAVATADFIIFAVSGAEEVGAWGESCIRSLASFGMGEGSVRAIVGVSITPSVSSKSQLLISPSCTVTTRKSSSCNSSPQVTSFLPQALLSLSRTRLLTSCTFRSLKFDEKSGR